MFLMLLFVCSLFSVQCSLLCVLQNEIQIIYICIFFLLHCRVLHDGTSIKENGIMDGSKIILLPNVETGLLVNALFFVINLSILS